MHQIKHEQNATFIYTTGQLKQNVFHFLQTVNFFVKVAGTQCLLLTQQWQLNILQDIISCHLLYIQRFTTTWGIFIMSKLSNKRSDMYSYFLTPSLFFKISWCHLQDEVSPKNNHSHNASILRMRSGENFLCYIFILISRWNQWY